MKKFSLKELSFRLLSASIAVGVLCLFLFFSKYIYFKWIYALFIATIGTLAIREYAKFARGKGFHVSFPLVMGASFLLIFSFSLAARNAFFIPVPFLLFFAYTLSLFFYHSKRIGQAIAEISISCFPILYVAIPLGLSFLILYDPKGSGVFWTIYLIAVTKIADIGGYFGGKLWGEKKLAPMVSPHKTIVGAIIGWLCAIIVSLIFSFFEEGFSFLQALILGAAMGVFGQIGDLFESLFKRDAKLKDSSSIPGMGGFLDLLDSLIFNIFVVFFFVAWS